MDGAAAAEDDFPPGTVRWTDAEGVTHTCGPHSPAYSAALFCATEYWSTGHRAWRSVWPEDAAPLPEDASSAVDPGQAAQSPDSHVLGTES